MLIGYQFANCHCFSGILLALYRLVKPDKVSLVSPGDSSSEQTASRPTIYHAWLRNKIGALTSKIPGLYGRPLEEIKPICAGMLHCRNNDSFVMLVTLMREGGRERLTATVLRLKDFVILIRIRKLEVP